MMAILIAGVKKSLMFNNVLNAVNFAVWCFIMIAGLTYIDFDNWTKHKGFMPYGWSGVSIIIHAIQFVLVMKQSIKEPCYTVNPV